MGAIQDYIIEVRKLVYHPNSFYPDLMFMGTIDKCIAPSFTQEIGSADQLTFNIQMSDPKIELFADDNQVGLEVWLYGRDTKLKQMFVVSVIELNRDYGSSSSGSGGGSLGGGSGDTVHITCTGLENYLARYIIRDYKVQQRMTKDIMKDICAAPIADQVISDVYVDPALNMPLDIDLSWENVQTAINNIITQTGGYLRVGFDPRLLGSRQPTLIPLPGSAAQPTDAGMTSPVLPQ